MNGQTLEQKQTLLRKQIYESGLDTEVFGQYMGTIKQEGQNIDLNNWTVKELQDLIIKFKQIRNKSIQSVINSKISHIAKKSTIFDFVQKQKVKYEGTDLWDYQINDQQECGKSSILLKFSQKTRPIIKVEKSQIKTVGGFIFGIGSKNELEVTLKTNFTPYSIIRKGEDCDWLRRMLISNYPGHFVPPLENQRELNREDKRGIFNRQAQIQRFLNCVACYQTFQTSASVKEFFDQTNYRKFVQFRTTQQSAIVQKNIDTVHTVTGSFTVNISTQINTTIKIASNISAEMNSLYGDLNNCCSKILIQLQNVSNNMRNLEQIGKKIQQKYTQIQKCLKIEQMNSPTIMLSLNDVVLRLTANFRKHMKIFSEFNDHFIRNAAKDWTELIANDRRRYNEQKNYLSFKDSLLRRKEKCVSDPTRWQIPQQQLISINRKGLGKLTKQQCFDRMFPVDTETQSRMRLYLAYVNQNYLNSYKLFLLEQQKDLLDKFNVYSEQYLFFSNEVNNSFIGFKEMFAQ